ncbi:Phage portal protein, HK97 [Stappia sp. 22II-S9-Z10]|nr:Phage portal protein, HK97 [Stappia sp. 22II-S9-Z10]
MVTTSAELEAAMRGDAASTSGVLVTPDRAMHVAPVYACVRIIAGAVATLPLDVKRRVDERTRENADDHPVAALLTRRPNRWMTPSAYRRMATTHVLLRGNAYSLKVRSRGRTTELLPLNPDRVEVEQRSDNSIGYVYTRKDGRRIILSQDEVMHHVGLTLDGVRGVSVIEYARESIGLAIQTEAHGSKFFANGANIGSVLETERQLGEVAQANLQRSLEDYRGTENAHKTLILEDGITFKPIGMSGRDAQYIETRKFSRADIAMFFGIPPHMLGDTEKSTSWGTGIEQQSLGFVAYTLQDWLTTWEETINRDLIGADDTQHFAKFNLGGLVRGDLKTRYEAYQIGRSGGWLSANDVRSLEDLNPIDGGDEYLTTPTGAAPNAADPPAQEDTTE